MTDRYLPYHQDLALVQAHQRELRREVVAQREAYWLETLGATAARPRQPFVGLEHGHTRLNWGETR